MKDQDLHRDISGLPVGQGHGLSDQTNWPTMILHLEDLQQATQPALKAEGIGTYFFGIRVGNDIDCVDPRIHEVQIQAHLVDAVHFLLTYDPTLMHDQFRAYGVVDHPEGRSGVIEVKLIGGYNEWVNHLQCQNRTLEDGYAHTYPYRLG